MNRFVSFGLLVAVILITGFVFYKVMAGFFLPLFLAALLVVLFRPMHHWILQKVKGREKVAAFLTSAAILTIVLLPLTVTVFFAANESQSVIRRMDVRTIGNKIRTVRTKLALDVPAQADFDRIDREIEGIQNESQSQNISDQREQLSYNVTALRGLAVQLGEALAEDNIQLKWDEQIPSEATDESEGESSDQAEDSGEVITPEQESWQDYARQLAETRLLLSDSSWESLENVDDQQKQLSEASEKFADAIDQFYRFKTKLLGGPLKAWLKGVVNPDPDELEDSITKGLEKLRGTAVSLGGAITGFLARFLFSVTILAIALFSFLLDGPCMLRALKQMSPLEEQYENELITEFDKVSRAVVMATLLSALAQGILAAIGFYFAGLNSIILLMVLTSVLALVPFVGAAAVWVPASLWLIFVEGSTGSGIFLAIYGAVIVSMADNVIKPFILHGQSNLHPLWALLSVLGGVSALGPIGILVGPMIVVFLQTLLKILQREIASIDQGTGSVEPVPSVADTELGHSPQEPTIQPPPANDT